MDVPLVRYADTEDGLRVAYQVFGEGPPCVVVPVGFSAIETFWAPTLSRVWERMAANLRVVVFDHRGAGLSDGFDELPTLSERALDIGAVMDATEMDRAHVMGWEFGSQVAAQFAAEYPDRVDRLVLYNSRVGRVARDAADQLAPEAPAPPLQAVSKDNLEALNRVGIEVDIEDLLYLNPSAAMYPDLPRQILQYQRSAGSRRAQQKQAASITDTEIVSIAPQVHAPTLIVHSVGNRMHHVGYARYLSTLIPDATLMELPGDDQMYWLSENWKDYVDAGIAFAVEKQVQIPVERALVTALFTDIVDSTARSVGVGDADWRATLDAHDRVSERVVSEHGGTLIKNTGDGILATFTMPSDAMAAALGLRDDLSERGIQIRTGIHAGEVEKRGQDISGATVNLAARVQDAAGAGEIYVTTTIREMLVGSPHTFQEVGQHPLKGFEGTWLLYKTADS